MDCGICCRKFNNGSRLIITCPYCDETSCLVCFKTYLMETENAMCMFCKKQMSLSFVSSVTPKIFHNTKYRTKRTDSLLSMEKSLLPETQGEVERTIRARKADSTIKQLQLRQKELLMELRAVRAEIVDLRSFGSRDLLHEQKSEKKFTFGCSRDPCRGFLESSTSRCGICELYTCGKCLKPKDGHSDPDHECNKDDEATATFIKKDTRQCPNCPARIHKIEGCDQMFCVVCKTAFSWNTGKIERGTIHNPHYYELQRAQNGGEAPRVPGDIPYDPCGRLVSWYELRRHLGLSIKLIDEMSLIYQLVPHIMGVELPRLTQKTNHSDLRVKYLMGENDQKKWRSILQARQKSNEKNADMTQIIDMFLVTTRGILNKIGGSGNGTYPFLDEAVVELNTLRKYVNTEMRKLKEVYGTKVLIIDPSWKAKTY